MAVEKDIIAAAQTSDLEALRRLIDLEKPHNENPPGNYPLYTPILAAAREAAARHNQPAALELLLDNDLSIHRDTVYAALEGDSKNIFDCMIAHGWSVDAPLYHDKGNSLTTMIARGNLNMVQFLISRGANPNALAASGHSALEDAASLSSIPIVDALLNAGAVLSGRSALSIAAGKGRADMVAHLLNQGAAINEIPAHKDISNYAREQGIKNALCEAAWNGKPEVVSLLLERGADVNIKDTNGRSALRLAESEGHQECIDILRKHSHRSIVR